MSVNNYGKLDSTSRDHDFVGRIIDTIQYYDMTYKDTLRIRNHDSSATSKDLYNRNQIRELIENEYTQIEVLFNYLSKRLQYIVEILLSASDLSNISLYNMYEDNYQNIASELFHLVIDLDKCEEMLIQNKSEIAHIAKFKQLIVKKNPIVLAEAELYFEIKKLFSLISKGEKSKSEKPVFSWGNPETNKVRSLLKKHLKDMDPSVKGKLKSFGLNNASSIYSFQDLYDILVSVEESLNNSIKNIFLDLVNEVAHLLKDEILPDLKKKGLLIRKVAS